MDYIEMDYKIDKICRVCLGEGKLTSIFTEEIISPSLMILSCTAVKIMKNDGLPSEICNNCLERLCIAFQFKQHCEGSDYQLRKYLSKNVGKESNKPGLSSNAKPFEDENLIKEDDMLDAVNVVCEMLAKHAEKMENKKYTNSTLINSPKDGNENIKIKSPKTTTILGQTPVNAKRTNSTNFNRPKSKRLKEPEKCYDCGKVFNYSGYLEAHIRTHTGQKPYECTICHKKFTQMGNLALHIRTHTGEKPFQCEICSKQFTTSSNMHAHLKIHTQIRDYQCTECPRAFKSPRELSNHAGTHTGIKSHICKICGKAFYKTSYLNIHLKTVHIGEKNYKCSECGKEFSNSSNLTCHYRIHTGEKPFSCTSCGASFNQSSALHRHRKQHQSNGKKRSAGTGSLSKTHNDSGTPNLDISPLVITQSQNIADGNIIIPIDFGKNITFAGCDPDLLQYAKTQTFHNNFGKRDISFIFN